LEFLTQSRERFGDVVRFQLGPLVAHFLYHPNHVSRVLRDHQKNCVRGWQYGLLRRIFGENLVVSEGAYWRRQRRLAQPAFHPRALESYVGTMIDAVSQLLSQWEQKAESGDVVEAAPAMSRLALEIAGRTFFGQDVRWAAEAIGEAFATVSACLDARFKHPLTSPPVSWPTPRNLRFRRAKQRLFDVVMSLIREHRGQSAHRGDLLSMLMEARDEESGERMTDSQICVEALTFLIAGHETTAKGLTWTLYLLASHPAVRERVRAEASAVFGGDRPAAGHLPRLTAARMAVEESLRLYPPVWALTREAVADDEIGGYRIPAKSTVVLSPYVTHRHPEVWLRPDAFDIDRFAAERVGLQPRGAYFPFISGPHQCIGMDFAIHEMCLVVAMVSQRFDFALAPQQSVRPTAALTLNPDGPVPIELRRLD
jgi:cytochrome P450